MQTELTSLNNWVPNRLATYSKDASAVFQFDKKGFSVSRSTHNKHYSNRKYSHLWQYTFDTDSKALNTDNNLIDQLIKGDNNNV